MKLRNKKTGEIVEFDKGKIILDCKDGKTIHFNSIEDLDNWEDYEETKGWYIDISCVVRPTEPFFGAKNINILKQCGNYFETREEAELVVRKLKAWKRLKDSGFEFVELRAPNYGSSSIITIKANCLWNSKNIDDLKICFGGEE